MPDGFVTYATKTESPTEQHLKLQRAFDFFNARLFNRSLPAAMVTKGLEDHDFNLIAIFLGHHQDLSEAALAGEVTLATVI